MLLYTRRTLFVYLVKCYKLLVNNLDKEKTIFSAEPHIFSFSFWSKFSDFVCPWFILVECLKMKTRAKWIIPLYLFSNIEQGYMVEYQIFKRKIHLQLNSAFKHRLMVTSMRFFCKLPTAQFFSSKRERDKRGKKLQPHCITTRFERTKSFKAWCNFHQLNFCAS